AVSLLFGSIVVVVNSILLARSIRISSREAVNQLKGKMFRSAVGRFVLLIGVLLLANMLGFHLLAVAAGMFVAYVGGYGYMIKFISEASKSSEEGRG
ncbi:MAG: ATP synthase subunit I, partial [Mariprofundaceae bacterium]